jgi:hypothetical protein
VKSINHIPSPLSPSFTLPPPTSTPPNTVPILQSYISLLIFKLMFKGVSQWIPTVGILYFCSFNSFHYSPLPRYLPLPIFNSFQYISLYNLIYSTFTDVMFYDITVSIILFLSLLPQVPQSNSTITNMC